MVRIEQERGQISREAFVMRSQRWMKGTGRAPRRPWGLGTIAMAALAASSLVGCAGGPKVDEGSAPQSGRNRMEPASLVDPTRIYQQMGFIAGGASLPFIGSVAYLAGPTPDSTLVLVAMSLPNRALSFVRESDRFRATYAVRFDLRQGATPAGHLESTDTVRVTSFKETTRGDESIIFQRTMLVAPGAYTISAGVRDEGSANSASQDLKITVPRLGGSGVSTPVVVVQARPRETLTAALDLVASPRSTATFGRDTVLPVYVEAYGGRANQPLRVSVRAEGGATLWTDTIALTARRNGLFSTVVNLPVSRLGVGITTLVTTRGDAAGDSTQAPVFVSFGDELPVASFEEMLNYLRYFASPQRLQSLRETPPAQRPAAWGAFLRETDPVISTPQHEGLRDYFHRLQLANERFRGDGSSGWMSDRGMVFITLGEPDQIYEQGGSNDLSSRGRALIWEYRQQRLQLVFIDQSGFNRWRLTTGSENDFQTVARRLQK
jgi:GWxTD domain-containing protein